MKALKYFILHGANCNFHKYIVSLHYPILSITHGKKKL